MTTHTHHKGNILSVDTGDSKCLERRSLSCFAPTLGIDDCVTINKQYTGFTHLIHPIPITAKAAPMHTSPPAGKEVAWAFFLATRVKDVVFINNL